MKMLTTRSSFLAAALLTVAGSAGASTVAVNVPFPFSVHGQTMPAGRYLVKAAEMGSSAVLIEGERGTKGAIFILTEPAASQNRVGHPPGLTFKRHETQYQLTGIWESEGQGRAVSPS
jgi:hypothetical protein